MSRTKRKILRFTDSGMGTNREVVIGGDAKLRHDGDCVVGKNRMKPYTNSRIHFKYKRSAYPYNDRPVAEGIRNANRSYKKGVRQQAKREILAQINLEV